jgi:hypothetical protein
MNCTNHDTALKVVSVLQQQLLQLASDLATSGVDSRESTSSAAFSMPEAAMRSLFSTAAVRQHTAALLQMCEMPEALHCVDAATLQSVLEQLSRAGDISIMKVVLKSLKYTAVQQLTSEAAVEVLQAVIAANSSDGTVVIGKLAAAKQIGKETLLQLLLQAVKTDKAACADRLFAMPAVLQLQAADVAQLLAAAVKQDFTSSTGNDAALVTARLLKHPAAQQLDADMLARALNAGLQHPEQRNHGWMAHLLEPAAQQLSGSAISRLILTAVEHEPAYTVRWLEQPRCKDASSGVQAIRLDRLAHAQAVIVVKLCRLPAAQHVSVYVAEQLMAAVKDPAHSSCKMVMTKRLPAIRDLERTRSMAAQFESRFYSKTDRV